MGPRPSKFFRPGVAAASGPALIRVATAASAIHAGERSRKVFYNFEKWQRDANDQPDVHHRTNASQRGHAVAEDRPSNTTDYHLRLVHTSEEALSRQATAAEQPSQRLEC